MSHMPRTIYNDEDFDALREHSHKQHQEAVKPPIWADQSSKLEDDYRSALEKRFALIPADEDPAHPP